MNKDQILSLIRTILKVIGGMLIAHGASKAAAWINAEDTVGLIFTIFGFITSHLNHKDDAPAAADKPAASQTTLGLWLLLALLPMGLLAGGCHSVKLETGGAYALANQQAQPELYVADGAYKIAYETIDGILKFERDNRAQLAALSPSIKTGLDKIRPTVWDVDQRWARARRAYRANPTPANLTTVQLILAEIQRLVPVAQTQIAPAYAPATTP